MIIGFIKTLNFNWILRFLVFVFAFSFFFKTVPVVQAQEAVVPFMQVNTGGYFASHYWPLGVPITFTITGSDGLFYTCQYYMHLMSPSHPVGGCDGSMNLSRNLRYGDTAIITDGTTTDTYTISNMQVTNIDVDADTISGIATPGNLVNIYTAPEPGPFVSRFVTVNADGSWLADFRNPSTYPDGSPNNDTVDIKVGSVGQAYDISNAGYENYSFGNATWIDWCAISCQAPRIWFTNWPEGPVELGQSISLAVEINDPDVGDSHTIKWDWGDGQETSGPVDGLTATSSHTYASAGVYTITVTVTDAGGNSVTQPFKYVVIYDPNGGFVTGGGWINSPGGAYTADPSLTGKATFGFVSKYQKGANVPTGSTEFQFNVAGLNFKSTSYSWLVVAGKKAQYMGTGTINGAGEYGFMLAAIDGSPDKFRIRIGDPSTGTTIYDNMIDSPFDSDPTTALAEGSIVIHK